MSPTAGPGEWGSVLYDDAAFADRNAELQGYRREWFKAGVILVVVMVVGAIYGTWGWMVTHDLRVLVPVVLFILVGIYASIFAGTRIVPLATKKERVLRVYQEGLLLPWNTLLDLRRGEFVPFGDVVRIELNEVPYERYVEILLTTGKRRLLWKDDIANAAAFEAALDGHAVVSRGRFSRLDHP